MPRIVRAGKAEHHDPDTLLTPVAAWSLAPRFVALPSTASPVMPDANHITDLVRQSSLGTYLNSAEFRDPDSPPTPRYRGPGSGVLSDTPEKNWRPVMCDRAGLAMSEAADR